MERLHHYLGKINKKADDEAVWRASHSFGFPVVYRKWGIMEYHGIHKLKVAEFAKRITEPEKIQLADNLKKFQLKISKLEFLTELITKKL